MADILSVVMRWLHISSVVTLIGGALCACKVVAPAARRLAPDARDAFQETAAAAFRPLVYAAIPALLLSGLYNILSSPGHTPRYHMLLGIKVLLALHVFAVTFLAVQPSRENRARLLAGAAISGFAIILISAYLRRIF